jgi:GNAT superfamily N-acetyltransferase
VIEIVHLLPDQWERARAVRLRSLADSPSAFASTHRREAALTAEEWRRRLDRSLTLVAVDGGEEVGTAAGVPPWTDDPGARELVGMWVAPAHRGRGVARALLARVATWAEGEGAARLRLGVLDGNAGARAAYLRMGMRPIGVVEPLGSQPERTIEILECRLHPIRGRGSAGQ